MSFSGKVREELSSSMSPARHCQIAELAAFIGLCGTVVINSFDQCSIKIHSENLLVARKVFTLIEKTFNIKTDISKAEYIYHGTCIMTESVIYIFLKNDFSQERATLYLINSVGDSNRFIGLFTALSSNQIPVCIKIACFKEELFEKGIDKNLLKDILTSSNVVWKNNALTIEERQKHLFFSDDIKK